MTTEKFPYSLRDYHIGMFRRAYAECRGDTACQEKVRKAFREMESGRLWKALEALHTFVGHLDGDEIRILKVTNPNLMAMLNEWAYIENLRQF